MSCFTFLTISPLLPSLVSFRISPLNLLISLSLTLVRYPLSLRLSYNSTLSSSRNRLIGFDFFDIVSIISSIYCITRAPHSSSLCIFVFSAFPFAFCGIIGLLSNLRMIWIRFLSPLSLPRESRTNNLCFPLSSLSLIARTQCAMPVLFLAGMLHGISVILDPR